MVSMSAVSAAKPHVAIESAGTSVQGTRRYNNEDCFYANSRTGVFIVADGVGGHNAGQVASRLAVRHLMKAAMRIPCRSDQSGVHHRLDRFAARDAFRDREEREPVSTAPLSEQAVRLRLCAAFHAAHRSICDHQTEDITLNGMSTTACVAIIDNSTLYVAHVGDSRVIHVSGNRASCLTKDHSFVELMRQSGKITAEQAATHPFRNVLLKYLGGSAKQNDVAAPDVTTLRLALGDRIVLATDGITDHINPAHLADIVNTSGNPDEAAAAIVSTALENHSTDDATCIVIFIEDNNQDKR